MEPHRPVLVFSDVHLGSPRSRIRELRRCLKGIDAEVVAVAGDLFDDEHRPVGRDEARALFRRALAALGIKPRMLIVSLSSSSHDPQIAGSFTDKIDGVEVMACNCPISFEYGGVKFVITHGDLALGDGFLAYLVDLIRPGQIGRLLRRRLGVQQNEWLIYGHSHVPYLSGEERILNPGAWKIYGIRRLLGAVYEMPSAKLICKPGS